MKKPLKKLDGTYVAASNGNPQRFTKRAALSHGRGEFRAGAPRISVRDAGSHWLLERVDTGKWELSAQDCELTLKTRLRR